MNDVDPRPAVVEAFFSAYFSRLGSNQGQALLDEIVARYAPIRDS